jgi:hypothetical protein
LTKSNKILYYRMFIRNPISLVLHLEWLHTCPYVFMSKFDYDCLRDGIEKTTRYYNPWDTEESIQSKISYFQSEVWQLRRYVQGTSLHRTSTYTPSEEITQSGIYQYINYYTPGGINKKINLFSKLISSDYYLDCHCSALFHIMVDEYIICNHDDTETYELPNLALREQIVHVNYVHSIDSPPPLVEIGEILPLDL